MSVFILADRVTATQDVTAVSIHGGRNQAAKPPGANNANSPTPTQQFQLIVRGVGDVSATAQPAGSNDGVTWVDVGSPLAAGTDTDVSSVGGTSTSPFSYFGAYITAISGTDAEATVTMSA